MSLAAMSQSDWQLIPSPKSDREHFGVHSSAEEVLINICSLPCSQGCQDQRGEALCPQHRVAQAEGPAWGLQFSGQHCFDLPVISMCLSACTEQNLPPPVVQVG